MIEALLNGIGAYPAGTKIGPAQWPHWDLIVVTRGDAEFRFAGLHLPGENGSSFLIPPGHQFRGRAGPSGCVIWVQHFRLLPSISAPIELPQRPVVWLDSAADEWSRSLLRRATALQKSEAKTAASLALLLPLLIQSLRENAQATPSSHHPSARKIARLIDSLATQQHPLPTVEQLAERLDWSTSHFRQEFRRRRGRSVGRHLRELRMQEASRLLQQSTIPIKEVAARLEYSDAVAFHHAFVNQTGTTPGRCRESAPKVA